MESGRSCPNALLSPQSLLKNQGYKAARALLDAGGGKAKKAGKQATRGIVEKAPDWHVSVGGFFNGVTLPF